MSLDRWAPGCISVNEKGRVVRLVLTDGAVRGEGRCALVVVVLFQASLGKKEVITPS